MDLHSSWFVASLLRIDLQLSKHVALDATWWRGQLMPWPRRSPDEDLIAYKIEVLCIALLLHARVTKQSTGLPPGKERWRRRFRICSAQPEKFNLPLGNVTILTVIASKPEESSNQESQLSTRLYICIRQLTMYVGMHLLPTSSLVGTTATTALRALLTDQPTLAEPTRLRVRRASTTSARPGDLLHRHARNC
jgi:hypothetical protein